MEKPIVYFTDFRCPVGTSQLDKLRRLCIAAGIQTIDMEGFLYWYEGVNPHITSVTVAQ